MLKQFGVYFVIVLLASCSSAEKRAEKNFESAQAYFKPLNDYRSVTCDMRVHLPESFKARKRGEVKGDSLKAWNEVFTRVEQKPFTWSLAPGNCQIRGMSVLQNELQSQFPKKAIEFEPFLKNLEAQLRVGSCVLLQALYYRSPFEGLRADKFKLEPKDQGGVGLLATNGKSDIHWYPESKSLSSRSGNGEVFMASYKGEAENIKLTRAALMGSSHQLSVEDIKYLSTPHQRLIIEEYILSLEDRDGKVQPQARVSFENCVARVRPPTDVEKTP